MPSHYSPYSPSRAHSRPRFMSRVFKQIRTLIAEILGYLQEHPMKTLFMVIIPLLLSGTLQKLLRKVGIRVPRWLQGKKHPTKVSKKQKKQSSSPSPQSNHHQSELYAPSSSEAIKLAASVGGMRGLMAMASMLA